MTEIELANKLLSTNLFIKNNFFDEYISLILTTKEINGYSEKHHILPRSYYEHNNLPVDSSADNVVQLLYADHCRAHYLLYYCTIGYLKQANACAVHYIQKMAVKLNTKISAVDFKIIQQYMDSIINDPESRYWSENEIALLKKYYPVEGAKVYKHFKNKSKYSCQKKANALNLFSPDTTWSDDELAILKQYYPLEGKAVYKRFKNRTAEACSRMARINSLKHSRIWTETELKILYQYYPLEGSNVYLRLPGRTKSTCVMKAKALEISYRNTWTAQQIKILKEYYPIEGAQVGIRLNKTAEACRQKASKLHIVYLGEIHNNAAN